MAFVAPLLGNIALNLAIGVGASLLASALSPQQKNTPQTLSTSKGFSFEMQVGEGAPVSAVVGLGRARGQLVYVNEYGTDNEYLQLVIKVGHGWHEGLETLLIDEKPMALVGTNADPRGRSVAQFTRGGVPYMWVKAYNGAPGQAADPELIARANPAGRWTAAHKMTGCAYLIITSRYDPDFYGSTLPLSGSVWRGLRLLDWRQPGAVWGDQSTYVWTRNPAVIRYNYRRGIFVNGVKVLGQGFSAFANDLAGYTAAANLCDEDIYEPVTNTTFKRYEFGREIGDDEEKLSVLTELDAAYCGSSFKRGGADVPLPAQQLVSVMTLTNGDRLRGHPVRADRKGTVSSKKTMWHGQFVSADVAWGLAPFTPRINTELESVLGGRRAIALDQPFEYLQTRAQARAEIALRRQFYAGTRVETFTPKAFALEPGDCITRVCEWGSVLMVVEKVEPIEHRLGVTVTLSEWSNTIVPASGDSFVTLPTEPGAGPANPDRTIAVSGLSVVPFQRAGGGAVHPFARATWTQITDPNVDQVMIRLWPAAGSEANDKQDFFASARLSSTLLLGPLQAETDYTGYAIPIRSDGRVTVKTNLFTFISGSETVPAEVPDGSVGLEKLNDELKNAHGLITREDLLGSVPDRLAQLEQDQFNLANGLGDVSDTSKRDVRVLKAQSGSNAAAVIEERKARVEADAANATLIQETIAKLGTAVSDAFLRFDVLASDNLTYADIAVMGRIGEAGEIIESGIRIHLEVVGGVLTSQIALLAQKLVITDGVHTAEAFRFDAVNGRLVLKELAVERVTSLDLTSLVIDGVNPEITFTGA
ncbi:hypothetical protein [Paradevosia shaoguanensis]|uniref:hypothetical protein n=1 Tax=Paradevosia shaoguanensis TaxID=1335043 RepID=UPI001931B9D7|nr:hypothetical protein [Paradevosia shaoguanensis]